MPEKSISYKRTVLACYFSLFTLAIIINLSPILFIPLRELYGLSFTQLGSLVFINFFTQVICDIVFSGVSDKYGFRILCVAAPIVASVGLVFFSLSPVLFPSNVYIGLVVSTIVFSAAGGVFEINISPVLQAIPGDEKSGAMSLLHSFYAWGQIAVVILTSLALMLLGANSWPYIALGWAAFPFVSAIMFMRCPLPSPVPETTRQRPSQLLFKPFMIAAIFIIFFGAATELVVSQWTSSFAEKGLGLSKFAGDVFGMSFFALMLGLGRVIYGLYARKLNLSKIMAVCAFGAVLCYIAIAVAPGRIVPIIACGLAGLSSSLLWPGTLSLAGGKYPLAGAWMFALLACAGDIGGAVGPWLLGILADIAPKVGFIARIGDSFRLSAEQLGLRVGLLVSAIFPLLTGICIVLIRKHNK